jgi:cellobiose transport system substrate-binding protein
MANHRTAGARRLVALGVLATLSVGLTAACGTSTGAKAEKITLVVDTFGKFGYDDLFRQYEASHPNITIKARTAGTLDDYWPKLTQYLATGGGSGDVVAIEEGILPLYMGHPDNFVNLADYGAAGMQSEFLDWKWKQGVDPAGKVRALGTDIGGLAMCYRKDLFAKAGLPTDRDEVSGQWPTWEDFRKTGLKFKAAKTGAAFVDSPTQIFTSSLMQAAGAGANETYFDPAGKLVLESNPAVRQAWDITTGIIADGLTSKIKPWTPEWNAGFGNGAFATIACPSWMLGIIEGNAGPGNEGKWDVAQIPGGGGNWGGSFLAVPVQSRHPEAAAELAMFLTSPASHVAAFKAAGTLPSDVVSLKDPQFLAITNPYFGNAPVGRIFGEGAQQLRPVYLGVKNQLIRERAIEPAIQDFADGKLTSAQAWQHAVQVATVKAK